jgi:hypothetical protein
VTLALKDLNQSSKWSMCQRRSGLSTGREEGSVDQTECVEGCGELSPERATERSKDI